MVYVMTFSDRIQTDNYRMRMAESGGLLYFTTLKQTNKNHDPIELIYFHASFEVMTMSC